jgi:hypothetical protein
VVIPAIPMAFALEIAAEVAAALRPDLRVIGVEDATAERWLHTGDGPFDLQQAYVVIGNHKEFPVSVKVGRQEIILGEHRLVGPLPWNNIQRQWDAVRLRYQTSIGSFDAFGSYLVAPRDGHFNEWNEDEGFSGIQFTTKKIPKLWSEFYFLSRNVSKDATAGYLGTVPAPFRPPAAQDIYTVGTYLKNSTNDWQNVDFGLQAYYQFGNFRDFRNQGAFAVREDHRAYAVIGAAGYTWKESAFAPRLGFEYSHASGDNDPQPRVRQWGRYEASNDCIEPLAANQPIYTAGRYRESAPMLG